jgi:cytochrome c oxidase assembly factor CtaG
MPDVGLPLALVGLGAAYGVAAARATAQDRVGVRSHEEAAFFAGLVVLATALVSPLDTSAERHLWVHMVQHLLLVSVAAPLLVLGRPDRLLPPGIRLPRSVNRSPASWLAIVAITACLAVGTLLVWHLPSLYDRAVTDDRIHALEHVLLLTTAVAFWWALQQGTRHRRGAAVLAIFVTTLPLTVLGVGMTLATTPWYPAYAQGSAVSALVDQQLAGVIMWAFGGLAALVGAVALFATWLGSFETAGARGSVSTAALPGRGPR